MSTTERGTCWSVTINNPIPADDDNIALARQKSGWSVEGQLERGAEGTPHYQLMVRTPQVRFSALKKAFPRSHIELARNAKALKAYVQKEDTREGVLPTSDRYPSMAKLWRMFCEWIYERDFHKTMVSYDPDAWLKKFDHFIKDSIGLGYVVETMAVNPQIRSIVKNYALEIIQREDMLWREDMRRETQEINIPEMDIEDASASSPSSPKTQNSSTFSSDGSSEDSFVI